MSNPEAPPAEFRDRRAVRLALMFLLAVVIAAFAAIQQSAEQRLKYLSLFHDQFIRIEPSALLVLAVFVIIVFVIMARSDPGAAEPTPLWTRLISSRWAFALAFFVLAVAALGTHFVFRHYVFIDDEYSGWFQSLIFAHGRWSAPIPEGWCRIALAITPTTISASDCSWHLGYLPVHSLIRAVFLAASLDWLAEPTLSFLSVLLVIAIARRVWPERRDRAWIAGGMFAVSTQVLFMSMTAYAMPAHLLFSLTWLWLYVRGSRWSIGVLPWVGVLAMGVHSPLPHLFWVPPFLFRFARERRWNTLAYITVVYVTGVAFWAAQLGLAGQGAAFAGAPELTRAASGSVAALTLGMVRTQVMHLSLLFTWNTPVAGVALVAVLTRWRRLDRFSRDLALSLLLTLAVRFFSSTPQGAGWGYRYAYAALGNVVLLAACGIDVLAAAVGKRRTRKLLVASLAVSLVLQIPMRAAQVPLVIGPYRRASDWLAALPQAIVVFPANEVLWGRTLLRNDPFFQRGPLLADRSQLPNGVLNQMQSAFPGRVRIVSADELKAFGLLPTPLRSGNTIIIIDH